MDAPQQHDSRDRPARAVLREKHVAVHDEQHRIYTDFDVAHKPEREENSAFGQKLPFVPGRARSLKRRLYPVLRLSLARNCLAVASQPPKSRQSSKAPCLIESRVAVGSQKFRAILAEHRPLGEQLPVLFQDAIGAKVSSWKLPLKVLDMVQEIFDSPPLDIRAGENNVLGHARANQSLTVSVSDIGPCVLVDGKKRLRV